MESAMNSRFSQRFEEGLSQIKESLGRKNGVKKKEKVWESTGMLKAKYPSMHKYNQIDLEVNNEGVVTSIARKQKPVEKTKVIISCLPPLIKKMKKRSGQIIIRKGK
jgi:hypothetical protein